jgi:serine/threonine-protein kinase RsbW
MTSYSKQLTIPSSLDEIPQVDSFLEHAFTQISVNEDKQNDILLAATEGVTNAIIHGNHEEADKSVTLTVDGDSDQLAITIEDEGPGFDPNDVPDPTADSNLLKTGGRGVFLMKEYADEMTYNSKGNCVTITFRLHD